MSNQGFEIPNDVEARLREQAEAIAASQVDESALLAQFVAEAKAKREAELRRQASEQAEGGEGTGSADSQGFPREYVELMVFKGQGPHDEQYAKVSINGYAWKIQRGEKVIVPSVVANVLNDAVQDITTQEAGGLVVRPAHRFPYTVIRTATEREYRDFMAQMKQAAKPQVAHV